MKTLNIVKERKAQILAEKLENRMQEILEQISSTHAELLFTNSFSIANKCNKELKKLLNLAIYYIVIADNLATKYEGELVNCYSINHTNSLIKNWEDINMYLLLKVKAKELSGAIKNIY